MCTVTCEMFKVNPLDDIEAEIDGCNIDFDLILTNTPLGLTLRCASMTSVLRNHVGKVTRDVDFKRFQHPRYAHKQTILNNYLAQRHLICVIQHPRNIERFSFSTL